METRRVVKMTDIILVSVALIAAYFIVPDILKAFFDIGKEVGEAIAKWI